MDFVVECIAFISLLIALASIFSCRLWMKKIHSNPIGDIIFERPQSFPTDTQSIDPVGDRDTKRTVITDVTSCKIVSISIKFG